MALNILTSLAVRREVSSGREGVSPDGRSARDALADLQNQVDRLSLITQALWELLRVQMGLKDEDLMQRIEEIDLRDGVKDGKVRAQPDLCPECQRPISLRTNLCHFCGKRYPKQTPF